MNPSTGQYSICDCIRLGKFLESRTQPILCTMCSSLDVNTVLAKRSGLSQKYSNIYSKSHVTPEALNVESILLKQRQILIASRISSKSIKISDASLFINNMKHSALVRFKYQTGPLMVFHPVHPVLVFLLPQTKHSTPLTPLANQPTGHVSHLILPLLTL